MIVALYLLLAVIQGQGAVAEVYGNLGDCEMEREQRLHAPDTLAISRCTPIELVPAGEKIKT
jgi:hypothetical protein